MEHFKLELIEYLDYYNNRRIKAKLKLSLIHICSTSHCGTETVSGPLKAV